jgi:uncharacterized SAM-binding protein YcdF (DUF218 family)
MTLIAWYLTLTGLAVVWYFCGPVGALVCSAFFLAGMGYMSSDE